MPDFPQQGSAAECCVRIAVECRQMAAGDHLRVVYEQLSKDPNSLANLDQDLPNYSQHNVPIFSLPQARCLAFLCPLESALAQ